MTRMSDYSIWHYSLDALPSVESGPDGNLILRLIIGTWGSPEQLKDQEISVDLSFRGIKREPQVTVTAHRIPEEKLAPFDGGPPTELGEGVCRTYVLTRQFTGNTYYEATVAVAAGTEVTYSITARAGGDKEARTIGPYRVVVAQPSFDSADAAGGRLGSPTWIAFLATERVDNRWFTHVRVDLDDISAGDLCSAAFPPIPVTFVVDDQRVDVDPGRIHFAGGSNPQLALIDWAADRITITLPGRPHVDVDVNGRIVDLSPGADLGETRLLIEHFAIQGINDLLEKPFPYPADGQSTLPARTYAQVTMRDEKGLYSSRPDTTACGADGYSYGFDAHRRLAAPYEIALNGGMLLLIAHDCRPEDGWLGENLDLLRDDVAAGLLHPTLAGYGSHRIPYYSAETNRRDIDSCRELELRLLDESRPVFYPDQRLYRQAANTRGMWNHTAVKYIVLDSDTGFSRNATSAVTNQNNDGLDLSANHLWQDKDSKKYVLFIDDALKDAAAASGSYTYPKPSLELRRRLLSYAIDSRLRRNLLVYGDDFEKACGNGWFEGSGTKERFFAFLEWATGHQPWLRIITTSDLQPNRDCVGTIDVRSSTDPLLGYAAEPVAGRPDILQFDYWERAWSDYLNLWAGGSLGGMTIAVEHALLSWPRAYRNALYETAWLAFLAGQHENAWNKAPIDYGRGPGAVRDPEDFTIVEGLQVRNVYVWLKASVWAYWAANPARDPQSDACDPVHDLIADLKNCFADPAWAAEHWDADPLETCELYNEHALIVLDRNGGRITHAFVLDGNQVRAVSGTFKAYQYRAADGVDCDGPVLQNTVWTPNHRYLAADLGLNAGPSDVQWEDDRPFAKNPVRPLRLPDNFNAYDLRGHNTVAATMTYGPGSSIPATTPIDQQAYLDLLRNDHEARTSGRGRPVVWHQPDVQFTKTFTLDATNVRVEYHGVPEGVLSELRIDNEFCIDLLAGAMGLDLLIREPGPGSVAIRSGDGRAGAAICNLVGCDFDPTSTLKTIDATDQEDHLVAAFLGVHRVLTEALQIVPMQTEFSFTIELDAR